MIFQDRYSWEAVTKLPKFEAKSSSKLISFVTITDNNFASNTLHTSGVETVFQDNKEDLYMILFFIPIKLKDTMFWQVAGYCANFPNDKATILHVNVDNQTQLLKSDKL